MRLPKECDPARQPTLTINKPQMLAACRLMTAYYQFPHTIGQAGICMSGEDWIAPINAKLLEAEGWIDPSVWIENRPGNKAAMTNIIRAVWPLDKFPADWTCTKLPELAPFCQCLDALEPETGWSFMAEGPNLGLVIPGLEDPRLPVLDMSDAGLSAPSYTARIAAAQVNVMSMGRDQEWVGEALDNLLSAGEALARLHSFLPPLIELAGGRCKLLTA